MSEHSPPAKRLKSDRCTNSLPANVSWLFLLPLDVWPIVRDLAGAEEAAVWTLVCTHFKTVVTTPEFWAYFERELKVELESHRQILSLSVPVCQTFSTPLHSLTIAGLSEAGQKKLVPLVTSIKVKELTLKGSMSPQILRAFAAIQILDLIENKYTAACLQQLLQRAISLTSLRLEGSGLTENDFTRILPSFTGLVRLGLTCCANVTDSALQTLRVLTHLQALDLEDCRRITGTGLQNLPIKELNLRRQRYFVNLSGIQVAFPTLNHLNRLSLYGLRESKLGLLTQITTLRHLDLLECHSIQGKNLPVLNALELETLRATLTDCRSRQTLLHLLGLPALVELRLQACNLTSQDLLSLQACPKLSKLQLRKCHAIHDLTVLRAFPVLADLTLYECNGLDSVAGLQNCSSLQEIEFFGCECITTIAALQKCRSLRKLCLWFMNQVPAAEVQDFRPKRPQVEVEF